MESFKNLTSTEKELVDNLEKDTLESIKDGNAVPLPEFLKENAEARANFAEALDRSEELKLSLKQLEPTERLKLLEVFDETFENLEAGMLGSADSFMSTSVLMMKMFMIPLGAVNFINTEDPTSKIIASVTVAYGLLGSVSALYEIFKDGKEREVIKKQIKSVAFGT